MLNSKQKEVVDAVAAGNNVLIIGAAGCGKSHVLCHIRDNFECEVSASTGIAALSIGGTTLHAWAGVGLAEGSAEEIVKSMGGRDSNIKTTNILVIDEISMISAEFFDKMSAVCSIIRDNPLPFGGIQLVLCGDFCQLPPIKGRFVFRAETWKRLNLTTVKLVEIFRQRDEDFCAILAEVRIGELSKDSQNRLEERLTRTLYDSGEIGITADRRIITKDGIIPTRIYPHNSSVDCINSAELIKIPEKPVIFHATGSVEYFGKSGVPEMLILKKGAQVVLLVNIDLELGLCNGSRGVVTDITPKAITVRFASGEHIIESHNFTRQMSGSFKTMKQFPLKLAYAFTVHKCQGMTLDCAIIDLGSKIFAPGQAYVALSRVKSLSGLYIRTFDKSSIFADKRVLDYAI